MENTAAVSKLFSAEPTILKPVAEIPVEDTEDNKPYKDPKLSLAQIKERESRTVFVGNVNLNCKRITLKKLFAKHGKVDSCVIIDRVCMVPISSCRQRVQETDKRQSST